MLEVVELSVVQILRLADRLIDQTLREFDRCSDVHTTLVPDVFAEIIFDIDLMLCGERGIRILFQVVHERVAGQMG